MIAIIDYDAGNIHSVKNAFEAIGQKVIVTRDAQELMAADRVVLPGVGSFGDAMKKLHEYDLIDTIKEIVASNKPFLAICLGLQVLFEESEEYPGMPGLGIIPGKVLKIPNQVGFKIPHIGWNSLELSHNGRLFKGLGEEPYVYFVHSYYAKADDESVVTASTEYVAHMHTSVESGNVFACQFHPEKSGDVGLKILQNFVEIQ